MFLSRKRKVIDLLDTVFQILQQLFELGDLEQNIFNCRDAIDVIKEQFLMSDEELPDSLKHVIHVEALFEDLIQERTIINEQTILNIMDNIIALKVCFQEEVYIQLNILFLPYKASMWDSLASIYEVAKKDENCVVKVIPIPYYQIEEDKKVPTYEGDLFPEDVPIDHYNSYKYDQEQPDIIFVHNIYDQYNKVTQVHEFFFTENLKKYTDMLVYVPYHISEPYKSDKEGIRAAYYLPGIKNVDKVILSGNFIEEEALKDGIPSEKILTLGSPKFDSMIESLTKEMHYPDEWRNAIKGKKVILLTTACTFFCNGKFSNVDIFNLIMDIPRYLEEYILIWRPHPLTLQTTRRYRPEIIDNIEALYERFRTGKEKYVNWENFLLDESSDYFPALKLADMLIADGGSLMQTYLLTEKSIMFLGTRENMPSNYLLPTDAFYYFFDSKQPWYKILKKFANGEDPLREKRKNLAALIYENTDGTCGEKVYSEIKKCIFERSSKESQ